MDSNKAIWTVLLFISVILWESKGVVAEQKEDDVEELKAIWKSQRSEIVTAHIKYRLFQQGGSQVLPLRSDEVKRIVRSKNLADDPDDLRTIVNKLVQRPYASPTPWSVFDFYYEGAKCKNVMQGSLSEVQLLTDKEQVEYSPVNNQVMIYAAGASRKHMRSMKEFREVPDPDARYHIEEKRPNLWILKSGSARLAVDPTTGVLYEGDYYEGEKIIHQRIQGSFVSYPGGIMFPSLSANVIYDSNGALYLISLSWIEEAEFNKELPKDTFSLAIPEKTNVFDNRNPSYVRTFPRAGPSDDVIKMADTREQLTDNHLHNLFHRSIWWIIGNIALLALLIGTILWRLWRKSYLRHS